MATATPLGGIAESAARGLLSGRVQGLGVRPAIANLARKLGLRGRVRNVTSGVEILLEGPQPAIMDFQQGLQAALPRPAQLERCLWSTALVQNFESFEIERQGPCGPPATPVPVDRALCADCRNEVLSDTGRRSGYAFTSCTLCGPRFSIIEEMPYERSETSMQGFGLCRSCGEEFRDADDRRFHAQTNACPDCGPRLWCAGPGGPLAIAPDRVLQHAATAVIGGQIVAIRGLGGYQFVCDAANGEAVRRLRAGKRRPQKPLAVMVSDMEQARRLVVLSSIEQDALAGAENPIVVARVRPDTAVAREVAPGLSSLGVSLPTTPLHALLIHRCGRPLVVTSGNGEGEPLAKEPFEAERMLAAVADLFVHHDRPIVHAIDDSVIRCISGRRVSLRMARGLGPLPLPIGEGPPGLAVGGHQKVAIALTNGRQAVLGPHLGDLDSLAMRERFDLHVDELLRLYRCRPQFLVGDLHPDYFTSRWIDERPAESIVVEPDGPRIVGPSRSRVDPRGGRFQEVRHVIRVQHHHAHIVAGMLEHGWQDRQVLGLAFDGTGSGPDGTIWGGEILRCTLASYQRVARLRPFSLPGGERAIREPGRVAVSVLSQALPRDELAAACRTLLPDTEGIDSLPAILSNPRLSPTTSSAGRLFDGIATMVLGLSTASYEGQPAIHLEDACEEDAEGCHPFLVQEGPLWEIDWRPAVRCVMEEIRRGESRGEIAMRFHRGLARAMADLCRRIPDLPVVLAGGVFQNRVLVERFCQELPGRAVGRPGQIPPNDGGLAAGQLAIGLSALTNLFGRSGEK